MTPARRTAELEPKRCEACGLQFSWLNLVINTALAITKGFFGIVAASRALTASALYSLNDVLSAVIVMISLRVARRPPDADHPYGHGKAEFVAVGIVSTVLVGAVLYVLTSSVAHIARGVEGPPHLVALFVALLTMVMNEFLARRGFCAAHRMGSPVLHTSAEHNRADSISSGATVLGVGGALLGLHILDPVVAIFETLHIIWLSGSLLGHSLRGLMDSALPASERAAIYSACSSVAGVREVLSLRTRQAGPAAWVDVEIAVPAGASVIEARRIADDVRRRIPKASSRKVNAQVKFRGAGGGGDA